MSTPLVSILMPTYNPNPTYLQEAIESVLNQTEKRWTLIIHDDASNTDVENMVKSYLHDERIRYIANSTNRGIGANWNKTLGYASTPYVNYLFQDDLWDATYLEKALQIIENNDSIGMVSVDHRYTIEGDGDTTVYDYLKEVIHSIETGKHDGKELLKTWLERELHPNIIGEPSFVLLRKELTDRVGPFREDMHQLLDAEYWTRCLQQTNWYFFKEELGAFRVHADGASAQNQAEGRGVDDRLRCFELLIKQLDDNLKHTAIKARNSALQHMIHKYLTRRKAGKKISNKSSNALKKFAINHPWLILKSIVMALCTSPPPSGRGQGEGS